MIRVKGYFRKGRKVGARSSLHNFRKRDKLGRFVPKAEVVEVVEAPVAPAMKKRGRPRIDG